MVLDLDLVAGHRRGLRATYSRELFNTTLGVVDLLDPVLGFRVSLLEGVLERTEPGVKLDDTYLQKLQLAY